MPLMMSKTSPHFNSRAHVERDVATPAPAPKKIISTHALTWSATVYAGEKKTKAAFQLTRSRGARRRCAWLVQLGAHFNSRAHVERDCHLGTHLGCDFYFNSRAHVERDVHRHRTRQAVWNFNSRAHVERDNAVTAVRDINSNFNSRAHVERDVRNSSSMQ